MLIGIRRLLGRGAIYQKKLFPSSRFYCHAQPIEVQIPVPWGTVAAKLWNGCDPHTKKAAICLHGWKDNSASFDKLIPLLVKKLPNYQFLAIDYPGHGFSSHFPPGMLYQMSDIIVLIGRIMKTFQWKSITIIGHSLGAIVGFLFTGTHNYGLVEKYVAIDALTPFIFDKHDLLDMIPKIIVDIILLDEKYERKPRCEYTYDEILNKFQQSHLGSLDEASCKLLMSRGVRETDTGSNKYHFTHDMRLRYLTLMLLSPKQIAYIARNFRTPTLYIKADEGVRYMPNFIEENIEQWLNTENVQRGKVIFAQEQGNHHLHISNADRVANRIVKLLKMP